MHAHVDDPVRVDVADHHRHLLAAVAPIAEHPDAAAGRVGERHGGVAQALEHHRAGAAVGGELGEGHAEQLQVGVAFVAQAQHGGQQARMLGQFERGALRRIGGREPGMLHGDSGLRRACRIERRGAGERAQVVEARTSRERHAGIARDGGPSERGSARRSGGEAQVARVQVLQGGERGRRQCFRDQHQASGVWRDDAHRPPAAQLAERAIDGEGGRVAGPREGRARHASDPGLGVG